MNTPIDCLTCFVRQSIIALDLATDDIDLKRQVMRSVMPVIENTDFSMPPAWTTTSIHRVIREGLGIDPYAGVKRKFNNSALALYPELKARIASAADPLRLASRLAIAGNIIDFGIFTQVDLDGTISRAVNDDLFVDDLQAFRMAVNQSSRILYLCDNAGEIVFDRLFIEALAGLGKNVTAVVKGSPVLNDATMEDAEYTGLTNACRVIDNGSDGIGTILLWCSPEFHDELARCDLVISKGQGNLETLETEKTGKTTAFLLQSKCDVLSRYLSVPKGAMMLRMTAGG
ncbi:MAG: DUF89 family protein [Nitrospirae bacterium]|nr:DUF89 family protein [Nitrospirota bacterium]